MTYSADDEREMLEFAQLVERQTRKASQTTVLAEAPTLMTGAALQLPRARELAAVSGRFDPVEVSALVAGDHDQRELLSLLAPYCAVDTSAGRVRWLLLPAHRTEVLRNLHSDGRLLGLLAEQLPPTDSFGEILRSVLRPGRHLNIEEMEPAALLDVTSALEALAHIALPKPNAERVQQLLAQSRFLADYDVLLQHGFFGRSQQSATFEAFMRGEVGNEFFGNVRMLIVTGLGGAGKSTFVAKLARSAVAEARATVVILDFDRPGINPADTYWMEMEISRQIAAQYPAVDGMLRESREAVREGRARRLQASAGASPEMEGVDRASRSAIGAVQNALFQVQANTRPILFVLDTFEEVAQRDLTPHVFKWLANLSDSLGSLSLRVVFSGRLFDKARAALTGLGIREAIELKELEPDHAAALLRSTGVEPAMAEQLAHSTFLPLRPLELKLLGRLIKSGEIQSVAELEREVQQGGPAARELFATLVYRRVLQRVGESTRAIAYPGLVLRYVTKELILEVLAPALDLAMTEAEAKDALYALAGYDWLAYRQGEQVWHRKDLRRSMLKAMIGKDRVRAAGVHRAAILHFERSGSSRDAAEAVYHKLMLLDAAPDKDEPSLDAIRQAYAFIDTDVADLAPCAAALLRFAVGAELSIDDIRLLPRHQVSNAYTTKGRRLVEAREFGTALDLIKRVGSPPGSGQDLQAWESETLFATAQWEALRNRQPKPAAKSASLRELVAGFFPDAVVDPEAVDLEDAKKRLEQVATINWSETSSAERNTFLERLALAMLILHRRTPLTSESRAHVHAVVKRARAFKDVSPLLLRRMPVLELLSGARSAPLKLALMPSTLRIDVNWLKWLIRRRYDFSGADAAAAMDGASQMIRILEGELERRTVRGALSAVDQIPLGLTAPGNVELGSNHYSRKELFELLDGPDHEFRNPARFSLLDAYPEEAGRRKLGGFFADSIYLKLDDLSSEHFEQALAADSEHGMEPYIELADRAGALGRVLQRASEARPEATTLAAVWNAYRNWSRSVRQVCNEASTFRDDEDDE